MELFEFKASLIFSKEQQQSIKASQTSSVTYWCLYLRSADNSSTVEIHKLYVTQVSLFASESWMLNIIQNTSERSGSSQLSCNVKQIITQCLQETAQCLQEIEQCLQETA